MQQAKHFQSDLISQHAQQVAEALLDDKTNFNIYAPPCESHAECAECQWQFYTPEEQRVYCWKYTGKLNSYEAAAVLDKSSSSIRDDRKYLQAAIQQYGDKILARWKKQSRQKRAALLQKAKPDLPKYKWPYALHEGPRYLHALRKQQRNFFLLPYLDVETLTENASILVSLLHHRATFNPEDWAPFDNFQLTYGWARGFFELRFYGGGVVMHGHSYGKLTSWNKHAAHQADMIGFPRGQLVLEAQANLMGFLRNAVELIVENLPVDEPESSAKWTQFTRSGMTYNGGSMYWSTYMYQPYSAPPTFSIDSLVEQAKARVEATGDHLWLLQTEPSYMRRQINLLQQMKIFDVAGWQKGIETVGVEITWDLAIHWFWQGALVDLEHTRDLYYRYRDSINPGECLPKVYDNALGALEVLLVNAVHSQSLHLQAMIPQRPGFHHLYKLSFDAEENKSTWRINVGTNDIDVFNQDPLLWCLLQLQGAPDDPGRLPYAMLLKFLDDHLAKSSTKEKSRLDEILYAKLSDFAAILEMLFAIRMHHPKCANRQLDDIKKTENRLAWRRKKTKIVPDTTENFMASSLKKFQSTSPPSGPKNGKWLEAFNATHEALQHFWAKVSTYYEPQFKGRTIEDLSFDMKPLNFWKSPEYRSCLEAKRLDVLREIAKPKGSVSNGLFLPLPSAVELSPKVLVKAPRPKPKTRGRTNITEAAAAKLAEELSQVQLRSTLSVPKHTLSIMKLMYPMTPDERRKSVDWDAFVTAMKSAGFIAKNGGGSVVIFESTSDDGKIIFHKPHPVPKIDPIMMQSMGRRMNKWFGWDRSLFVLAGKE